MPKELKVPSGTRKVVSKKFGRQHFFLMRTHKRKSNAEKHKKRIKTFGGKCRIVKVKKGYQVWEGA